MPVINKHVGIADPNNPLFCSAEARPHPIHATPLLLKACTSGGKPEDMQRLLPENPSEFLNAPVNGSLFLHEALRHGQIDVAVFLIEQGAKPEEKDAYGLTAYDIAMLSPERETLLPKLIGAAIGKNVTAAIDPTNVKAAQKLEQQIRAICDKEPVEGIADSKRRLEELMAAPTIDKDEVCALADKPLDVEGNTIFHFIAAGNHQKLLNDLIRCGVNPNQPNFAGQTPVHFAAATESPALMKLVQAGGDINQLDQAGISPLALIGILRDKRDVLELRPKEAILAMISIASVMAQYVGNPQMSALLSAAPVGIMLIDSISKYGVLRGGYAAFNWSLIAGYIHYFVLSDYSWNPVIATFGTLFIWVPAAIASYSAAKTAFAGIKSSWDNRRLDSYRAFRNIAVRTVNFTKAASVGLNALSAINQTYEWFARHELESQNESASRKRDFCRIELDSCARRTLYKDRSFCESDYSGCAKPHSRILRENLETVSGDWKTNPPTWKNYLFGSTEEAKEDYDTHVEPDDNAYFQEYYANDHSYWKQKSTGGGGQYGNQNGSGRYYYERAPDEREVEKYQNALRTVFPDGLNTAQCQKVGSAKFLARLYRSMALQNHPDKCVRNRSACEGNMVIINNAFELLRNSESPVC